MPRRTNWSGEHFEWIVDLPAYYPEKSRDTVALELTKAGDRLAELLRGIWLEA